ncbi:MAG TPA: hypothetical protein VLS93_19225 [Anaeromyxobacteraceae bacterium]|nr:hypothetical protein [Anaeromyxobacteraceae bacterium]
MLDPRLAPYRGPSLAFAGFLVMQAASGAVLFSVKIGADPDRIRTFYLGSEATFAAPKSLAGMLEVAVPHLLAIPLVLFAAAHVVGFARALGRRSFSALVAVSFGSALGGVAASFVVRFLAPSLAWAKLGAFLALEASLLSWAALLAVLFVPRREPARLGAPAGREPAGREEVAP